MEATYVARLREGLKAYGYVEGRNLELLVSFTGGSAERAREAAKAYADRGVDVIVATATPAVTIVKQATEAKKIPIVMAPVSDPIATGFAASIARPGGYLTGMSMVGPDLSGKRLGLLREIMPDLTSVAFIGWTLVDAPSEIDDKLMAALKQDGVQAVVVQPIFMGYQDRIIAAARTAKLPIVSDFPAFALSGGLFTYGIDDRAQMQRAAYFIDRIVKGTSPADLPIELPTDYVLIVNQKTAAELGLTVSPTMLQAATEVVE